DGAKITSITKDGPAEKGGLKVGDIIRSIESKAVPGYDKLIEEVYTHKPNDKVRLSIEREGVKSEVTVTLGSRPAPLGGGGQGGGRGGAAGAGGGQRQFLTPGFFGEDVEGGGVEVTRLVGESASKAGLKEGDLVSAMDGQKITGFRDTIRALMAEKKVGDKIKLSVERGKEKREKLELT